MKIVYNTLYTLLGLFLLALSALLLNWISNNITMLILIVDYIVYTFVIVGVIAWCWWAGREVCKNVQARWKNVLTQ